ncbi:RNA polymerase factor sigma-54 [Phaeocystidibacter marisrubri]|uniref:RNA polymerase factor sigma-54 n=1 Tax=Phaeocystidibacter marisrubri TaxID=1577780 RepID=A0A6L3ZCM1_9FLAO|nr:RNA polymerase factor sigma-54 [Phaeocystidibacter marisrubri]KAB2815059.1 RNA polymerase factor sigma-54 [Phaeocystidibacter marisrubri]GGH70068.1 RNA polymerase sigma-54 factor [Phaeocystidibacter marisrubri]
MLKQSLQQKLQQKLSPQQIQLMKLIQLPTQALEERIQEELEANPALDEGREEEDVRDDLDRNEDDYNDQNDDQRDDDFDIDQYLSDDEIPEYRLHANNYSADDDDERIPLAGGTSFVETLRTQLGMRSLSEEDFKIAFYLVGNIDDDGYLRRELQDVVDDLAFTQGIYTDLEHLEVLLKVIQDLDPPGVGARSLQECLSLQLRKRTSTESVQLAQSIIDHHFDEFVKKHFEKLMDRLDIVEDQLRSALNEISRLNPKPGNSVSDGSKPTENITPDFLISIEDGELRLKLNGKNAPELNISREYKTMLEHYRDSKGQATKSEKDALMFVKQKIDAAKWFIDAIRQRQQTLLLTMSTIMEFQEEYFLTGDERKLKPMILKDIAEKIDMDISTVSRVASNKYVQTPYGTHIIKSFFSESMKNSEGEDVSTREIKKILEDSIGEENKKKPLTDEALAKLLKEKGYPIARRTVAKYREQLGIPVARLRKEL